MENPRPRDELKITRLIPDAHLNTLEDKGLDSVEVLLDDGKRVDVVSEQYGGVKTVTFFVEGDNFRLEQGSRRGNKY